MPSTNNYDFLIVGGGIAGASAGYELAAHARVAVIEREGQPGYHSTGRSAALYLQTHGPAVIQALARAARPFFLNCPEGFAEYPLLTPRGALIVGRAGETAALQKAAKLWSLRVDGVRVMDTREARALVPVLRDDYVAGAVLDSEAMDIDVNGVHWGFLRGLRGRGGALVTDAELLGLERKDGVWRARTAAGDFAAPTVIDAAGAWCDKVAAMAGARPVGLAPKRRTAFLFDPPGEFDVGGWPAVIDFSETFYFKPDAGKLLGSPADQTPMEPCDVQPDDLDVAVAVDRIQNAARLPVQHIRRKWAGLRSFVADGCPVVGYDPEVAGFFWLAGQGGYGIETSPSMGRLCASLAMGRGVPSDLAEQGVAESELSPARLRRKTP